MSLFIVACDKRSSEQVIRDNINEIQEAIEARDNRAIMDYVSEQFLANNSLDKAQLRRMIAGYFLRYKNIPVVVTGLSVEVDEADPYRATVRCKVLLAGGNQLLPEAGKYYSVHSQWIKSDKGWKVTRLDY